MATITVAGTTLSVTPEQANLWHTWQMRREAGTLSPAVEAVGQTWVLGVCDDAITEYPVIQNLAALDQLTDDEQFAIEINNQLAEAHGIRAQRRLFAINRTTRLREQVNHFDPTAASILILGQTICG